MSPPADGINSSMAGAWPLAGLGGLTIQGGSSGGTPSTPYINPGNAYRGSPTPTHSKPGSGNQIPPIPPPPVTIKIHHETLQAAATQWLNQCVPHPPTLLPESDFRYSSDPASQAVKSSTQDWENIYKLRAKQEEQAAFNIVNFCHRTSSIMVDADQTGADRISNADGPRPM